MIHNNKKRLLKKDRLALGLIFFLFCYTYLWIVVKPHLIYHGFGTLITDIPVFATGVRFLMDSLSVPGGWVIYLYGFVSQGYYESWLGALLIMLIALSLCELSRRHYATIGHPDSTVLSFFPAVMIVLLYNQYNHPLTACLASFVGLLFSLGFESIPVSKNPVRMAIFCLMAAVNYWIAGAGGVFVFSIMTAIYLLFGRRSLVSAALIFPAAAMARSA